MIAIVNYGMGNFVELKEKYKILNFNDRVEEEDKKKYEILNERDFKRNHQYKLKKLLDDKIDVFSFYLWLITNWPSSKKQIENYKL